MRDGMRLLVCAAIAFAFLALARLPSAVLDARVEGNACPADAAPYAPVAQAAQAPARNRPKVVVATATIRGRVYAADTGAPLRRARVSWTSDVPAGVQTTNDPPAAIMTDSSGSYEIRNLPAGRYRVYAKRTGYVQVDFGARRAGSANRLVPTDAERGVSIDLREGQAFNAGDIYLLRAGVITGRVLDEVGDPVISAFVGVGRLDTTGGRRRFVPFGSDTTDDLGEYRVSGLPPGTYLVLVSPPAVMNRAGQTSSYADVFYPGVVSRDDARPIVVRAGDEVDGVTFTMTPVRLARISGTVATSTGATPKAGTLSMSRTTTAVSRNTVFEFNGTLGSFAFPSVAPGLVRFTAEVQADNGVAEVGFVDLVVTGEDIDGVTIATAPRGRLTGTVRTETGVPLPSGTGQMNVSIASAQVVEGEATTYSPVKAGSFDAAVPPGQRLVGFAGLPAGWGLAAVSSGGRNITDLPIEVKPGSQFSVQMIVSNRLPEVSGVALDGEGKPTWDYTALIIPRDPALCVPGSPLVRTERPNQRGEFRFANLRPGDYDVVAVAGGEDVDWSQPDDLDRLRQSAGRVSVALGDKKAVQLRVTGAGTR